MRVLALALVLSMQACSGSPAYAEPKTHVIVNDPGGLMADYTKRYREWARNGDRVVIDGLCGSACTLVLSKKYNLDVCVTAGAVLAYHKPFRVNPDTNEPIVTLGNIRDSMNSWWENWVAQAPGNLGMILATNHVPSVYEGAAKDEVINLTGALLHAHVKTCE